MKAVVLNEYGGPDKLKYQDFADPEVGPDEVLVRIAATSVNPVDFKMRSGEVKNMYPVEFPGILGFDLSGVVRAVGQDVTGFAEGDRVMGLGKQTYAELVTVKADTLTMVPDDLGLVEAGALPLVLLTGEQLMTRALKVEKGWTVLVAGAIGGVGRTAVYTAKQAGATVIAGVRKRQLEEAKTLGADEVVALDDKAAMAKVGFLDGVADAVGGETAQSLMEKVKQGGVFGSVLGPPANAKMHPTVRIAAMHAEPDPQMLRTLAEAVAAKKLVIPIDRMLPLSEAADGQRAAEKGGIGKVLLLATDADPAD